jgi:hypothetical protein
MSTHEQTSRPSPLPGSTVVSGAPDDVVVAVHAMEFMRLAQAEGRRITALDLAESLQVRRADVRRVVSELDRRGHVDALRMRLTLLGFAYVGAASSVLGRSSRSSRRPEARVLRAA